MAKSSRIGNAIDGIVNLFVRRPMALGLSIMAFALLLAGVAFAAYPFAIETSGTTFVPKSASEFEDQETLLVAEEVTRFNPYRSPNDISNLNIPQQTYAEDDLTILFEVPPADNVFTTTRIQAMRTFIQSLMDIGKDDAGIGFGDVCLRDRTTNQCALPRSLLPFFFAEQVAGCPAGVYNPNGAATTIAGSDPEQVLRDLIDPAETNVFCATTSADCTANCRISGPASIDIYVGTKFGFPNDTTTLTPVLASDVTRVVLDFGLPLEGFADIDDRYDDQIKKIEEYLDRVKTILDDNDTLQGMKVRWLNDYLLEEYFLTLFFRDTALIIVSIVIVWAYMIFHLQSVFLASTGMLHVLISFPLAYFFAQISMDFGGMGLLNLMSLFIILGIGADDVFILVDAWKQSGLLIKRGSGEEPVHEREDERNDANVAWFKRRMAYSYNHAAKAMLITSLTTGAAFVMNLTSTVPAIQIFGGFTAFMVLFNYLLVITYYPCMIVLYEYYGKYWYSFISCCIKKPEPIVHDTLPSSKEQNDEPDIDQYRPIEQLFYKYYAPAITTYRWFIVAGFAIFFIVALAFATQLDASDEPAQFLPDDDPLQQTLDIIADRFQREESQPQLTVVYGLRRIDMDGTNPFDPSSTGKTRFDNDFDVSSQAAQAQFIDLCVKYRQEAFVFNQQVFCPMEAFRDWVVGNGGAFPVPEADFVGLLANFTRDYEDNNGPAPDYSGATSSSKQDAASREGRRLGNKDIYQTIRFDLTSTTPILKYMVIIVNTTLSVISSGAEIEPAYDHWNGVMARENSDTDNVDVNLDNGFQTAAIYIDMVLENTLLDAAVIGIAASISLSFAVIVIMTSDFLLSILSIIAIGGVVTSLIATIVWMGWSLSIIESVCMTILVGLAVDYVIHMAQAYRESRFHARFDRVRDALTVMGISVLSASITSMLSALVLVFTYIIFFQKFGTFILLTILMSTLWAFGFFMAMLSIMGNQTHHNDWRWIWNKITGKDTADENNPHQPGETVQQTTFSV
eukprot:TRINITY_DN6321_c0_g1_i3.p1 TRINITY_DN6321_c0_g1~~TRINITY_DN6321_c0_g1_i3.p1  ORF type:complete len:1019 (+),score=305.40 TRINITY_DN6321_c0_g1_i3:108-3164(+)